MYRIITDICTADVADHTLVSAQLRQPELEIGGRYNLVAMHESLILFKDGSMMRTVKLPSTFKPKHSFPFIRMGSPRDGGYLIDERLVTSDLISFGISGDWQFERHWRNRNPSAVIETYDGSINGSKFLLTAFLSLFRPHKPRLVLRNFTTAIEYVTFLKNQTRFYKLFVGNDDRVNWVSLPRGNQKHRVQHSILLES